MRLHCPVCISHETHEFFAFTALGMPPESLRGGVIESVPDDGRIAQVLYGPAFNTPMIIKRFCFPPRPRFTSLWSIACFVYAAFSVFVAIHLTSDILSFGRVIINTLVAGVLIGSIPFWRRRRWDRKWTDRGNYLTRVASCSHCGHAWRA
ncbi:MAG: hypothetical protein WAM85_15580 [Terracidiphilus sp.]